MNPDLFINATMIFATVLGAGKIAMNGLNKSVDRIEKKIDAIDKKVGTHSERIAVLWEDRE